MSIDAILLVVVAIFGLMGFIAWFAQRRRAEQPDHPLPGRPPGTDQRSEAYFKAMFPELQPYFHPEKVLRFVRDRNARDKVVHGYTWSKPRGFGTGSAAVILVGGRERIRLFGIGGERLAEIDYEQHADGAALRIGRGKLTAVLDDPANPRVRYWHPEREFKWSRKRGWQFTTAVAEEPFNSSGGGSSFSSDRDSLSHSTAGREPEMRSGEGGVFGGGGAGGSWEGEDGGTSDKGATAY